MPKKKCGNCGTEIDKGWDFCPYCGEEQGKEIEERKEIFQGFGNYMPFFDMFDSVSDTFRDFDEFSESPELDWEEIEKEPKTKFSGIDINITNINGKPDVRVKTFGDFRKYEPEIWEKLGINPKAVKEKEVKPEKKIKIQKAAKLKEKIIPEKPVRYEEVKGTNIRRLRDRIIYEFDMPGITNPNNVRINKLESSYEIKAFGEDKAYFKLLPVAMELISYKIEKEKLVLEFAAPEI